MGPSHGAPAGPSSSLDALSEGSVGDGELERSSLEGALLGDAEGKSYSDVIVSGGGDGLSVGPSDTVAVQFSEALRPDPADGKGLLVPSDGQEGEGETVGFLAGITERPNGGDDTGNTSSEVFTDGVVGAWLG